MPQINGLTFEDDYPPNRHFKYESPVTLGKIEIFPGVSVGMHTYIIGGQIRSYTVVGRYCSIGRNVSIGTGTHNQQLLSTSPFIAKKSKVSIVRWVDKEKRIRVQIGNDVWIGDQVVVLNGVTIGHGAIVGAGAVVTKDVEPYQIIGGIPAKAIKSRFDATTRERLLKVKWWELDPKFLTSLDVDDFEGTLDKLEHATSGEGTPIAPVKYNTYQKPKS